MVALAGAAVPRPRVTARSRRAGGAQAPGDAVLDLSGAGAAVVRLGNGLQQDGDVVRAIRVGTLRATRQNKHWVQSSQKRYTAAVEDVVVGIIVDRHVELFLRSIRGLNTFFAWWQNFAVDIRGTSTATLPVLAFEGATRRNRPNLKVGAAVYARVVKTHPDMEPELACTDAGGKGAGFGPLVGGYLFDTSTGLARMLLSRPTCAVLAALGENMSFELAVGLNGRVWVNTASPASTVLVSNGIMNAEFLSPAQQQIMVKKLLRPAH
eukprot:SM000006S19337  [mRNA]  locus=s6:179779:182222:- [translate_table: standard]